MQRIFARGPRMLWFGLLGVSAFVVTTLTAACSDSPTDSGPRTPAPPANTIVYLIVDETCEYGGTYPNCNPPPSDSNLQPVMPATGGGSAAPPDTTTPCATDDPALNDLKVQEGLDSLWAASNADAPALGDRRETYAWIVQTATGYELRFTGLAGTFCGLDETVYPPPEGKAAVVGWVHTHPYRRREWILTCGGSANQITGFTQYTSKPSRYDRRTAADLASFIGKPGLRGYLIDSESIVSFTNDRRQDRPFARCGF